MSQGNGVGLSTEGTLGAALCAQENVGSILGRG